MQSEIFVYILLILLLVLFAPIFVQVRFYFNALQNLGAVAISVFGIKISCVQIEFDKDKINVISLKKDKQLSLDPNDQKVQFTNKLMYQLFLRIKIIKLTLFCDVGKVQDAFLPAMIKGGIDILLYTFLSYCYTKKSTFETVVGGQISSQKDELVLSAYLHVVFNVLTIILSLVRAKQKTNKEASYAKSR